MSLADPSASSFTGILSHPSSRPQRRRRGTRGGRRVRAAMAKKARLNQNTSAPPDLSLHGMLVILDEELDVYHSKVAPQCVLSLLRRLLIQNLSYARLVSHEDRDNPHNKQATVYYSHEEIRPEGCYVDIIPQNVCVSTELQRVYVAFDDHNGWFFNVMFISPETAHRICTRQMWPVFQRAVADALFDLRKMIYQLDGIWYAPIYWDESPSRPDIASAIVERTHSPQPQQQQQQPLSPVSLVSHASSSSSSSSSESEESELEDGEMSDIEDGSLAITFSAEEEEMLTPRPLCSRF